MKSAWFPLLCGGWVSLYSHEQLQKVYKNPRACGTVVCLIILWDCGKRIRTSNRKLHLSNPGMTWTMSHPGWLRFRDPYVMAYEIIPKYNWVVFHPLYTANNQGFCSLLTLLHSFDLQRPILEKHIFFFDHSKSTQLRFTPWTLNNNCARKFFFQWYVHHTDHHWKKTCISSSLQRNAHLLLVFTTNLPFCPPPHHHSPVVAKCG